MNRAKQNKRKKQGWRIGSVADFLELSAEEARLIEIKLVLSRALRKRRTVQMAQAELARRIESSQPRVAKAESGDRSISMDLLVRALLATGATP